jgi:endonuclease/exonuclease/phosphatase (EEP) superfamily protein YafD
LFKLISFFTWGFFLLVTLFLGFLTVIGFYGQKWWVFELAAHFRVQYFYLLAGISLLFLIGRKKWFAVVSLAFTLTNLTLILPFYLSIPSAHASGETYRFLFSNLLKSNTNYSEVRALIQETNPDIILFAEVNQSWMSELSSVLADYPYQQTRVQEDNYGIALFSRLPVEQSEVVSFGERRRPSLLVDFILDGEKLRVIGTHPPPPIAGVYAWERNQQISRIARFVADQTDEVIVAGDLNMTSWSPNFSSLLESGLRDSRIGFGVQASWPTDNRLLMIPIDHILVSRGIDIHRRELGPHIGSDHLPVIMDFSMR